jgi:hypothetical protein
MGQWLLPLGIFAVAVAGGTIIARVLFGVAIRLGDAIAKSRR